MSAYRLRLGTIVLVILSAANAGCQTVPPSSPAHVPEATMNVQTDQRTRDLYLSVIEQLEQYEKYHAALAHIDEFERLYGATPRSRGLRGDAWLALGQPDNAEKEYAAIARGDSLGAGQHGLGRVAAARGDWALAVTHFERAVQEQPTNTRFLTDLGHGYTEVGRMADAEFTLKKAQELTPVLQAHANGAASAVSPRAEPIFGDGINPELSMSLPEASQDTADVVESQADADGHQQAQ